MRGPCTSQVRLTALGACGDEAACWGAARPPEACVLFQKRCRPESRVTWAGNGSAGGTVHGDLRSRLPPEAQACAEESFLSMAPPSISAPVWAREGVPASAVPSRLEAPPSMGPGFMRFQGSARCSFRDSGFRGRQSAPPPSDLMPKRSFCHFIL